MEISVLSARTKIWIYVLVALVLAQTAASLLMPRGDALTIVSDMIQGALLLVATVPFLPNITRARSHTLHIRLFWILMSAGMILWLTYQGMWNYFEVVLRSEVPEPFVGDVVLFLHLVPMIAALAVLPHLREDERDERIRMLDFALLLTWWVFVYVYTVVPWQTVQVDEPSYTANFNFTYLTEKIVLLVALAVVAYTTQGGWRQLYGQLLGASALYASSSYVANWAIARKIYYSGSIYDIPLTVSMAWMGLAPLLALRLDLSDSRPTKPLLGIWITRLSMVALFSLLWAAVHAQLDPNLSEPVKAFRIIVSLVTMGVMGIVIFWRQRLLRNELSQLLERSRRSFDDLKSLQDKLIQSEKLASLGQLVGGAAHEINNPLTAMLGYSDLLSASNLPAEEAVRAAQIGEQVRRTTTLVASLLTFARQAPAKLAPVYIDSVLQTTARLLGPQMEIQGNSIRLALAPDLPPVWADSNQILHVCIHLAGQIRTQLDPEKRSTLLIHTRANGNNVVVEFMSSNTSDKLPEPTPPLSSPSALQAESNEKPLSLSLSACCRIVEEHGGRLLLASNDGDPAFQMEIKMATAVPNRASFASSSRAAAR